MAAPFSGGQNAGGRAVFRDEHFQWLHIQHLKQCLGCVIVSTHRILAHVNVGFKVSVGAGGWV